ncbi:putative short-chain dehydrogenase [Talaromyces proteolyticus]|uniref:Short-chain dehydrogenase n=1 Tax=Talaromyces proteolyticus TaxID=1131652 RepID=A0AAD4KU78_9EURO|nr:putative short-chain dehydrogenase [Talaromyces proteolyticus]KAH8699308.1 putative short-chain dehydrogenase [Talaromyces proteolyticus]
MGSNAELYPGNELFKYFTKTWHNKSYPQISPVRPELWTTDRLVFITGGGSGIGKATAIAFAHAGAKVIAIFGRRNDRLQSAAEEIRKANTNGTTSVIFDGVDLSQHVAVDAVFASAVKQAGGAKIDVFIHNAGILQTLGTVAGYDEEEYRKGLELNMIGAFNTAQAMLPLLAPKAKVFNVSSCIAHISPLLGSWKYAATKAANTKMFDYLQAEHPDLHIVNINADTEMAGVGQDDRKFVWVNWDVDELKARADGIKDSLLLRVLLNGVPL